MKSLSNWNPEQTAGIAQNVVLDTLGLAKYDTESEYLILPCTAFLPPTAEGFGVSAQPAVRFLGFLDLLSWFGGWVLRFLSPQVFKQ